VPLATFTPFAFEFQQTSDNVELLVDWSDEEGTAYARRLKLNGIAPPVQPLP
jgi:hypothetical protein